MGESKLPSTPLRLPTMSQEVAPQNKSSPPFSSELSSFFPEVEFIAAIEKGLNFFFLKLETDLKTGTRRMGAEAFESGGKATARS